MSQRWAAKFQRLASAPRRRIEATRQRAAVRWESFRRFDHCADRYRECARIIRYQHISGHAPPPFEPDCLPLSERWSRAFRIFAGMDTNMNHRNTTPDFSVERSMKTPKKAANSQLLVGRIGFVISSVVHRLPRHDDTNRCRTRHDDANRCGTETSPGLLGRRRGGRQMFHNHHGQLAPLSRRHELV